jgi:signal transduction histidine kinase
MSARVADNTHRRLAANGAAALAIAMVAIIVVGRLVQTRWETDWLMFASELVVGVTVVVAGWIGWRERPDSRVGPLIMIAGLFHLVRGLGSTAWPPFFTLSLLLGNNYKNVLAHALITFPSGRIQNWQERWLVIGAYTLGTLGSVVPGLFDALPGCGCPQNLALIADSPATVEFFETTTTFLSVFLAAAFVAYAVRKYRRATPPGRRALAPVFAVGAIGGVFSLVDEAGQLWLPFVERSLGWFWANQIVTVLVPLGFLAGLMRTRLARSALGDLVVELGAATHEPGDLAKALAERLRDPTLEIAFRVGDGFVDKDGRPLDLPTEGSVRGTTVIEADGEPIAALLHDPILRHEPELVDAAVAAARLAIANERLRAEVRAQLEEVRASRQRIVEAGDRERRRVERNLHDGAQQRLVTLSLSLAMLRDRAGVDADTAHSVAEIADELRRAIAELRELARGIHPAILTEEGLGAAVRSLTERATVPVRIHADLDGRLSETVEATAYFVVSESLTNISKYANAAGAEIQLTLRDRRLTISVIDDGVGGAEPSRGSGLLGLRDRVAALGGTLEISSPPGAGTRIYADIPFDD